MAADSYTYSHHDLGKASGVRIEFEGEQLVITWDGNRHTFNLKGMGESGAYEILCDIEDMVEDVFTWAVNKGIEEDRENTLNERDWTYL